ncbi:hypothetical protein CF326_g4861 [Tilletia indica]|nr:hypothetical protein CF326_g4861 [Tilletia indica]
MSSFQQVKHFINDAQSEHAHLTSTLADKADMAHVLHDRSHKREVVEAATLLATLALSFVGVVGYIHVLAEFSSDEVKRHFYRKQDRCWKKAFIRLQEVL